MPRRTSQPQPMSVADTRWALADEYLAAANDPTATPDQRAYAQNLYDQNVALALAAEDE